jgi:hypothetical protein
MNKYGVAATVLAIFLTGCSTVKDPFCGRDTLCTLAMKNNTMPGKGSPQAINQGYGAQVYQWGVPTGMTVK